MANSKLKLLLIDGNNMSHRVYWTHQELQYKGKYTGLLFGFIKQLIFLRKKFPEHYFVIAWDRGYSRRKEEAKKAVLAGIIPSGYKEQREIAREEADPKKLEEMESLNEQMRQLQYELLPMIRCTQTMMSGVEADDLIYSFCQYVHKYDGEAIVVSSDRDFLQVLGIGQEIKIFDAMKEETWTIERFEAEFGFSPELWVTAGALMGDTSDNIFGVDGWGPKTACDYVRQHGTVDKIIEAIKSKPKQSKKEQNVLESIDRLKLALSLKKMDDITGIPRPNCGAKESEPLYSKFLDLGFMSLTKDVKLLV